MISPELQFLLCCVRVDDLAHRRANLQAVLPQISDWAIVFNLAHHHGLIPLVYVRLKEAIWDQVPKDAQEAIEIAHRMNSSHSLSFTGELIRLLQLFNSHNIFALPYKGPALAVQLYGDVAMRQYGDLDVIIKIDSVSIAIEHMAANGWLKDFTHTKAQEKIHIKRYKDYHFYSTQKSIRLELHWKFADGVFTFPLKISDVQTRAGNMLLLNQSVNVPAPEDLILMLCFHGAMHIWERLSWLADIAQLLVKYPDLDWAKVITLSNTLKCNRVLAFSLILAHELFNAAVPSNILAEFLCDKRNSELAETVKKIVLVGFGAELGLWETRHFHLAMCDSWRERAAYRWNNIFRLNVEDWSLLPITLPSWLFFLYYPIRFLRLMWRYILKAN